MIITWPIIHWLLIILFLLLSVITALHALLHKRDPRSALLWIIISLSIPVAGSILYLVFGINRTYNRVQQLSATTEAALSDKEKIISHKQNLAHHSALQLLGANLTNLPIMDGNTIKILADGEGAFPAMLESIDQAKQWIYLSTYIFEDQGIGQTFIDTLTRAVDRGVAVYVLLDAIGAWYNRGRTKKELLRSGINVISFISPKLFFPLAFINLRNHRKVLLVDGQLGFTGGMNIRQCHLTRTKTNRRTTRDFMFRIKGPVLKQIEEVFREDWLYASGEKLPVRQIDDSQPGACLCRTISDGPGIHLDILTKILIGAINSAHSSIVIMSPYFLPPREIIAAIQSAALRGVEVALILPERNNLPYVKWAMQNSLWQLLQYGVTVYYQPAPFVHSKLLVIDEHYAQIGSANMDFRSLRLNFELVVEIYDLEFGKALTSFITKDKNNARRLTLEQLQNRSLPIKVRDAFCWLFTPYL